MIVTKLPEQIVFGLDIGTRSIVGTVGYRRGTKDFIVAALAVRFHTTRAMLDGQIHDISAVAKTIAEIKKELEEKTGRKLTDVCIAAAGRALKTYTVHTNYDFNEETTITDEMIRSMELIGVEQAHAALRKKEREAAGYFCVGYSVIKYYLGDTVIGNLEGHKGNRIGADVLATFLPEDVIDGLYSATGRAGLNVINLTLEPIAAINLAIPEKFRLLNLALVDVGAGTSDICITKEGSVSAYGMIPCAGDFLTESIMHQYLVEFSTAEQIKMDLTAKKKKIVYNDIMGLKNSLTPSDVKKTLDKPIKELTEQIAEEIKKLNGGKSVSAVFVVGGGGKNPEFTKMLAKASGIPEERVALRGEEVLTSVNFLEEDIKKDPTLVTPIGICLNYYEQNNNFIFVKINNELIKLYDNGKLSVMDAALAVGFKSEMLFPARGKSLQFTYNGEKRLVRGEAGESSIISVNGKSASISTPIVQNDEILIRESTAGKEASCTVEELDGYDSDITFFVNSKRVTCPRLILNKGDIVTPQYKIKENDVIKVINYYTVDKLIEYMDIENPGTVFVNNIIALGDEKLYENFMIDFGLDNADNPEKEGNPVLDKNEDLMQDKSVGREELSIQVYVNGLPVLLTGKKNFLLVDVLDVYNFDTSSNHGDKVVIRINKVNADFATPIKEGDQIELFWE